MGLLDDDPNKIGTTIHSIPILGKIEDLHTISTSYDEIFDMHSYCKQIHKCVQLWPNVKLLGNHIVRFPQSMN